MTYCYNFEPMALESDPKRVMETIDEGVREFQWEAKLQVWSAEPFDRLNVHAAMRLLVAIRACEDMLRFYPKELVDLAKAEVLEREGGGAE